MNNLDHSLVESLFRASSTKFDKQYEFVPINLHLQRMQLIDENTNTSKYSLSFLIRWNI